MDLFELLFEEVFAIRLLQLGAHFALYLSLELALLYLLAHCIDEQHEPLLYILFHKHLVSPALFELHYRTYQIGYPIWLMVLFDGSDEILWEGAAYIR